MSSQMKWKQTDKGTDNDWVNLNQDVENRLRIDKNLSDVADKSEARKNLGLVGDINTHNHDNRYQTQINSEVSKRQEQDTKLDNRITTEINRLQGLIDGNSSNIEKNNSYLENLFNSTTKAERDWAVDQFNKVNKSIETEQKTRDDKDKIINTKLEEEITGRKEAVTLEATSRQAGDTQLQKQINDLSSKDGIEQKERIAGDNALKDMIDATDKKITQIVAKESEVRANEDKAIHDAVSSLQDRYTSTAAKTVFSNNGKNTGMTLHWNGQGGQPTWIWGGNDGENMYVYNPLNFHVKLADTASNAQKISITSGATETRDVVVVNGIAGSDFFRIRTGGINDVGWTEIATGDNGNDPLYIRQYNTSGQVQHQVTLLNENGDSVFGGRIYANGGISVNDTLNLANNTWNRVGDDAYIGDCNVAGSVGIRGANGPTSLSLVHRNGSVDNRATITYDGGNLIFNKNLQANITGNSATATTASRIGRDGNVSYPMTFHWNGQNGQPSWLWGGNDGTNMYVYNPTNFSVRHAGDATRANTASKVEFDNCGIYAGGKDNGDAISNRGSNMTISSWWGIGYYNTCYNKYTISMDTRSGAITCLGNISAARVYNAVLNDYAELFEKGDDAIEAGDILALNLDSEEEEYVKATEDSAVIVGICSNEYAHLIGGKDQSIEENLKEFAPVALAGRVHVKVTGEVHKGDKITASHIPGVGRKAKAGEQIVGIAVAEPKDGKVRVIVRH